MELNKSTRRATKRPASVGAQTSCGECAPRRALCAKNMVINFCSTLCKNVTILLSRSARSAYNSLQRAHKVGQLRPVLCTVPELRAPARGAHSARSRPHSSRSTSLASSRRPQAPELAKLC